MLVPAPRRPVQQAAQELLSSIRLRSQATDDVHAWAAALDPAVRRLRQEHTDAEWPVILEQLQGSVVVALTAINAMTGNGVRSVLRSLSVKMRQGRKLVDVCPYGHVAQALKALVEQDIAYQQFLHGC